MSQIKRKSNIKSFSYYYRNHCLQRKNLFEENKGLTASTSTSLISPQRQYDTFRTADDTSAPMSAQSTSCYDKKYCFESDENEKEIGNDFEKKNDNYIRYYIYILIKR